MLRRGGEGENRHFRELAQERVREKLPQSNHSDSSAPDTTFQMCVQSPACCHCRVTLANKVSINNLYRPHSKQIPFYVVPLILLEDPNANICSNTAQ